MVQEDHSVHMEDNRFLDVKKRKKKHLPHILHWYLDEDYFSEEILGVYSAEVSTFKTLAQRAFDTLSQATDKIIEEGKLSAMGIPVSFHKCLIYSWKNRQKHPFLYGRFDINGGMDSLKPKIIEFNADTCSTVPETIYWQKLQIETLRNPKEQFNNLQKDIIESLSKLKRRMGFDKPSILASSFGYPDDVNNCTAILSCANEAGYNTFYTDLENVIFSEDGIFYEVGDEYERVDVWFKIVPWDWIFNDEPELARTLTKLILEEKVVVLNPAFTTLWQNKKFLAYITKYFPNSPFAETYVNKDMLQDYVEKPIYGRIGENIKINASLRAESKGDFGSQEKIYQKYYPLVKDKENYFYQTGVFYTNKASAINFRAQETPIINEDCEFMSHYLI